MKARTKELLDRAIRDILDEEMERKMT